MSRKTGIQSNEEWTTTVYHVSIFHLLYFMLSKSSNIFYNNYDTHLTIFFLVHVVIPPYNTNLI
jgi:hypothetical protein